MINFSFSILGLLAAVSTAQPGNIMGPLPGVTTMTGPSLLCAQAFAFNIEQGETVHQQEGVDFQFFEVTANDGNYVIYEGNFPQPHDDEIQTGLAFPSVIAIHDGRSADARARRAVRDRMLTGAAYREACSQQIRSE